MAQTPEVLGKVKSDKIAEASGLAASAALPGYYWTHNDSGGKNEVYLLDSEGKLVSIVKLKGSVNRDWEDIAENIGPGGKHYVYVGDIGNNLQLKIDMQIYRFPAPTTLPGDKTTVHADVLFIRYPDGFRDAESLMIDPIGKCIYIVSKREKQVSLYKVPAQYFNFKDQQQATLEKVLTLPYTWITAGDISQNGEHIVIKDKSHIYYWRRKGKEPIEETMARPATLLPYVPEKQGEGLTISVDNKGYLTISEGKKPDLFYYPHLFR
ncbi:hypothetical protein [Chitinophaga sp.]|uniref:hypothetical protein n=1 Tax=Chitinophaga sp. TaxID=1869181 RepID=UPI0031D93FCF